MQVLEGLLKSIRDAAIYNPDVQVAPVCILWPDNDRQWETIIPHLQMEMPELFILGDYEPGKRTGPAVWLRCVIAGTLEDVPGVGNKIPVLYLPGISRQDLRAVDHCPPELKPLVELQYRGVTWSQINAKDWTILAFLKSRQGGLGLDVAQDKAALKAMNLAMYRLLEEEIEPIKQKRLDKDYFNTLLIGGDPVRDLLLWLDNSDAFCAGRTGNEWQGFIEICKSRLSFDPENEGILVAAAKLAGHDGPWQQVWERFCEAPKRYPHLPAHIRKTNPPTGLFSDKSGWPQWNEKEEQKLRSDLLECKQLPPNQARDLLIQLNDKHKERRQLVWAELGEAPLARALEGLTIIAQITAKGLDAGTLEDIVSGYCQQGWQADDALLKTLACIQKQEDLEAVKAALTAVYLPWANESARYLQTLVQTSAYPGGTIETRKKSQYHKGECILFVDGLRFDVSRRLSGMLILSGYHVEEIRHWAALPSLTSTCKPAVAPVGHLVRGQESNAQFEPSVAASGKSLKGGYYLNKLLKEAGWEIPGKGETGTGAGNGWCEFGDIDHEGHTSGWKLAVHLESRLLEIKERIQQLFQAGWQKVRVVTDHGWLLFPGGLPGIELPPSLVDNKWHRCAAIKAGAQTPERLFPWYWNPEQHVALADGIHCYRSGEEYTHGGLSFQESLTLELEVSPSQNGAGTVVKITGIYWKGLRCKVELDRYYPGLSLDIRQQPGNATSSIITHVKSLDETGSVSVIIEDEEKEGTEAFIVIVDQTGHPAAQAATIIGGEEQ